jgi:hypothetical protein
MDVTFGEALRFCFRSDADVSKGKQRSIEGGRSQRLDVGAEPGGEGGFIEGSGGEV